jgi:hypothetical protein
LTLVGTALVSGEVHALIGLALAAAAHWRKIRLEEQHLAEAAPVGGPGLRRLQTRH